MTNAENARDLERDNAELRRQLADLRRGVGIAVLAQREGGDAAVEDRVDELAGDGEVDLGGLDAGDGHADDLPAGVDHRPARVTRVHAAVDLDLGQPAGRAAD